MDKAKIISYREYCKNKGIFVASFTGPPGVGKSSIVKLVANKLGISENKIIRDDAKGNPFLQLLGNNNFNIDKRNLISLSQSYFIGKDVTNIANIYEKGSFGDIWICDFLLDQIIHFNNFLGEKFSIDKNIINSLNNTIQNHILNLPFPNLIVEIICNDSVELSRRLCERNRFVDSNINSEITSKLVKFYGNGGNITKSYKNDGVICIEIDNTNSLKENEKLKFLDKVSDLIIEKIKILQN